MMRDAKIVIKYLLFIIINFHIYRLIILGLRMGNADQKMQIKQKCRSNITNADHADQEEQMQKKLIQ